jgi:NitT/TauT family transport system substrate-binding protein
VRITALSLAVMLATGCSEDTGAGTSPRAPGEVRFGYCANVSHAQAVLGVASGDYERAAAPWKLSTRVFSAGPSLVEALFAGEIDIAYIGPGPALNAYRMSRGKAVRVVAGAAANGVVIIAAPQARIVSMADLAGKRIATPQMGNTQDLAARHYVMHDLQQGDHDNVIPVPSAEQAGLMSRGQIDAAWAPEPWAARLEAEAGARVIAEEKDLWPDGRFMLTMVIVHPEFLARQPDVVERLLRVHLTWTGRLQRRRDSHVVQLRQGLINLTGKEMDRATIERALGRVAFMAEVHEPTFETLARWSIELGFSRSSTDLAGLIDTSLLDRLLGERANVKGDA